MPTLVASLRENTQNEDWPTYHQLQSGQGSKEGKKGLHVSASLTVVAAGGRERKKKTRWKPSERRCS